MAMPSKAILVSLGVICAIFAIISGKIEANVLWWLLLPFFYIGEPWYASLKKDKQKQAGNPLQPMR
jgi:hypothetical protein